MKKLKKLKSQPNPMHLKTGRSVYQYLRGKSAQEIEDYCIARGMIVVLDNGKYLKNDLYAQYQAEVAKHETVNVREC